MTDNIRRTIVQHSSASNEWYTPVEVVEAARATLGGIDLDPASSLLANTVVKATEFYSEQGLEKSWYGRVFCNPPGGRLNGRSQQKIWWDRFSKGWAKGEFEAGIFVAFSLEMLQVTQSCAFPMLACSSICIPKKRLKYWRPEGPAKSPPHASAIVYVGPKVNDFKSQFWEIGYAF